MTGVATGGARPSKGRTLTACRRHRRGGRRCSSSRPSMAVSATCSGERAGRRDIRATPRTGAFALGQRPSGNTVKEVLGLGRAARTSSGAPRLTGRRTEAAACAGRRPRPCAPDTSCGAGQCCKRIHCRTPRGGPGSRNCRYGRNTTTGFEAICDDLADQTRRRAPSSKVPATKPSSGGAANEALMALWQRAPQDRRHAACLFE